MTDQIPTFYCSPAPELRYFAQPPPQQLIDDKASDMQDALSSWWVMSGCAPETEKALLDTLTFGCGILKTGFDPDAQDGEGNAFMRRVDPYNLCPDPNCSSFTDASYVVEVTDVPLFEIKRRFPEMGDRVAVDIATKASDTDKRPRIGRGGLQLVSVGSTNRTGDFPGTSGTSTGNSWAKAGANPEDYTHTVRLKEVWIRTTERSEFPIVEGGEVVDTIVRDVPAWEYIAVAGDVVLTPDTSNPFDHGQLPYVRLPMVENGEFWSMALSQHLRSNVVAQNRLLAAMQSHAELTGNPILLEPEASGLANAKIVNRPGTRLITNMAATNLVRWLDPPNMSPAVMQLIGYHRDTVDRVSGISAVARGTQLRRREPAAAVDAVQEASFVRIRAVLRNYEEALRLVGDQVSSLFGQFYTEPRVIPIVGPKGSQKSLPLAPNHFRIPQIDPVDGEVLPDEALRFQVWVQAGSSQPLSRMARAAEADMLYQMGAIGTTELLEAHDYPGAEELGAKMDAEKQQMAQAAAMQKGS